MSRQYRIQVYGQRRQNIDPALLAQVVILFGRHLNQQRQQQQDHQTTANVAGKDSSEPGSPNNPGVAHLEPPPGDTPHTSNDDDGTGEGGLS